MQSNEDSIRWLEDRIYKLKEEAAEKLRVADLYAHCSKLLRNEINDEDDRK